MPVNYFHILSLAWSSDHTCRQIQCLYWNQVSNNLNFLILICELKTYDTRKKTSLVKFEECSCVRKRAINVFLFPYICQLKPVEVHEKNTDK